MKGKRIIILGATGMVGGSALDICLEHPDIARVTSLGRRRTGREHSRLREVVHGNFLDFTAVNPALTDQDAALFCLGAYTGTVPDEEFRRITVDYTVTFARALKANSPQVAFCLLSGQGADQSERSRIAFARYKGAAEKALLKIGFPRVHIFRPGYIFPVTPRAEPNLLYRITRMVYPGLKCIYPNIGISSTDLAQAMVRAGLYGTGKHQIPILENKDIRFMVAL